MGTYFSTFIPGLGEVVKNQLEKSLSDFHCQLLLDGLILYKSGSPSEEVKNLRFLNNSFIAISVFSQVVDLPSKKIKTFRVITSNENELVHIPNAKLEKLEKAISAGYKLKPDRANPDVEFWHLIRHEGQEFYGVRITKHPDYKTVLQKGQLRPELANLMCLVAEPITGITVLDPFAGSGAIPAKMTKLPHGKIIAGDIAGDNKKIIKLDATKMIEIADQSVNRIVTDPPWGVSIGTNLDLPDFYSKMLSEFHRVLKPQGLVVILIGKKELFEEVLAGFQNKFFLAKKYDILVSGKKAAIYKIKKA